MILILSNKWDVTVDFVIKELQNQEYPYLRLNTEDLPDLSVTTEIPDFSVTVEKQGQQYDLTEDVGAVWYRRPGKPFEFTNEEDQPDQGTLDYIREQWAAWLQSLQTIPRVTWVNPPDANHRMESKIHQLRLAHESGFTIPETLVTNTGSEAVRLFEKYTDSMIAKALSSPLITDNDQDEFVFSVLLDEPPSKDDESLNLCPTIFQEPQLPKKDYRVTVVGDKVFAVRIEGKEEVSIPVDWRTKQEGARFVQVDLPNRIEDLCRRYVSEAGLYFGAIDLVEVGGEYVFLEINPNGEWGWLQKPWDVPIAENLTELLIQYDTTE